MSQTQQKPTVTMENIVQALRDVGLTTRDLVVVHSSLSSFGYVQGGPGAVVDAVLEVIGPEGTVVFPTFTGSWTKDLKPSIDDLIYTGVITKTARKRDDFVKSFHPLYAICAKGPLARELCDFNDRYMFPAARHKFLHVMSERGGKVLLLGVDHDSNSSVHLVEEFGDLEYKIQDKTHWSLTVDEFMSIPPERQKEARHAHSGGDLDYSTVARFNRIEKHLKRADVIRFGKVGNADIRLMRIADLVRVGLEAVRKDPWLLRDKVVDK